MNGETFMPRSFISVVCISTVTVFAGVPAISQSNQRDLIRRSSIIFEGAVTQNATGAMEGQPVSRDFSLVRVDRIIEKPDAVSLKPGDMVAVRLVDAASLQVGAQAVFYTNGRIFGERLAVEEVGHEDINAQRSLGVTTSSTSGQSDPGQLRRQIAQEELQTRIQAAPVVVVGRVTEVRTPSVRTLSLGAGAPVSEHDPNWREATVQVQDAIKGASTGEELVVRFPASEDVLWFDKPKLQVGESGTFILQPDTVSGAPRALRAGVDVPAYTLERKEDVLPANEGQRVRSLSRP
jgi:hypothetical protein